MALVARTIWLEGVGLWAGLFLVAVLELAFFVAEGGIFNEIVLDD